MKKKVALYPLGAIILVLLASSTILKTSGSHPGSAGAPGDLTCAQSGCHTDAVVKHDTNIVNHLLFSGTDSTYMPGNSYTLTLQVNESHTQKFGFELVALSDLNNTNCGTFTLLEPTRTQILNYVNGTDLRYSVSHKTAGTGASSPGVIQWTMKWTAPATNAGDVTFWYASNCTNNDNLATGDYVFLSSFKIKAKDTTATGVKTEALKKDLSLYFNRDLHSLRLKFESDRNQESELIMFDMNGKLVLSKPLRVVIGMQELSIRIPDNLASGAYIVSMNIAGKATATKIWIDN